MVFRWVPPPPTWIKVYTDGSALSSPGLLCGGAIFRNHQGFFISGIAEEFGIGYAYEAELGMALTALSYASNMGWPKL
ncbi:hypothetical protein ACS0TY_003444 [Phlomoides rotata]